MKLDNNKQESSDLKVFGVGPKDSEIKSKFVLKNLLVCFIIASHMLHDDVTIKQIKHASLKRRRPS